MSVPKHQMHEMVEALLERPLLVMVDASTISFLEYTGGIYGDPDCSRVSVNHALQLVGYGVEDTQPYWICKNSFGGYGNVDMGY